MSRLRNSTEAAEILYRLQSVERAAACQLSGQFPFSLTLMSVREPTANQAKLGLRRQLADRRAAAPVVIALPFPLCRNYCALLRNCSGSGLSALDGVVQQRYFPRNLNCRLQAKIKQDLSRIAADGRAVLFVEVPQKKLSDAPFLRVEICSQTLFNFTENLDF